MQLDDHLGGQRQGALGADDELGQVVAGGDLGDLAAGADDLAGGQRRLQAEHVVAGDAVFDRAHAAGVGADVAADAGGQLAGWTMYRSPVPAVAASSSVSVTPGWTTATWLVTSTSSTAFMRSNEISRPSARGIAAPDRPVPEPRAVTGTWFSVAALSSCATSSAVAGLARYAGRCGAWSAPRRVRSRRRWRRPLGCGARRRSSRTALSCRSSKAHLLPSDSHSLYRGVGTAAHRSCGRRCRAVATRVSLRTLCRRPIREHAGWTVFDVAKGLRSGLLVPRFAARYPVRAV